MYICFFASIKEEIPVHRTRFDRSYVAQRPGMAAGDIARATIWRLSGVDGTSRKLPCQAWTVNDLVVIPLTCRGVRYVLFWKSQAVACETRKSKGLRNEACNAPDSRDDDENVENASCLTLRSRDAGQCQPRLGTNCPSKFSGTSAFAASLY